MATNFARPWKTGYEYIRVINNMANDDIAILSAMYVLSIDKDKKKERGKREWSTWIRPWLARRSHK